VVDIIVYAIPFFALFLALEVASLWFADDDEVGYEVRDTITSLSMGLGNVVVGIGWKALALLAYAAVYELTPLRVDSHWWPAWVLLFFTDDLAYYWFHRVHHEVRLFWASHVVHHSSRRYNLSTALRQTWTSITGVPFWLPLGCSVSRRG